MPAPKDVRWLTGHTVKQYGRFHLKQHDLYVDGQIMPSGIYDVQLENEDGSFESYGSIKKEESTAVEVLALLYSKQHQIFNAMHHAQRLHDYAKDDETKARFQTTLDAWKPTYTRLVRAIQELEPDFQPNETIIIHNPQDADEGTCNLD